MEFSSNLWKLRSYLGKSQAIRCRNPRSRTSFSGFAPSPSIPTRHQRLGFTFTTTNKEPESITGIFQRKPCLARLPPSKFFPQLADKLVRSAKARARRQSTSRLSKDAKLRTEPRTLSHFRVRQSGPAERLSPPQRQGCCGVLQEALPLGLGFHSLSRQEQDLSHQGFGYAGSASPPQRPARVVLPANCLTQKQHTESGTQRKIRNASN